jgi:hypothetical protein
MKKTNPVIPLLAVFALVSTLGGVWGPAQPAGRAPSGESSTTVKRIGVRGNVSREWPISDLR